ncbi:MAG: transposon-encoded TnpW family protein [Oscillospiraceae bacterium]|nr:transposon-encoded TnpW family protein [Oscillospiraceae bacterium]
MNETNADTSAVEETATAEDVPTLSFTYGKRRYEVGIHFSQTTSETMEDRIRHLAQRDMLDRV